MNHRHLSITFIVECKYYIYAIHHERFTGKLTATKVILTVALSSTFYTYQIQSNKNYFTKNLFKLKLKHSQNNIESSCRFSKIKTLFLEKKITGHLDNS